MNLSKRIQEASYSPIRKLYPYADEAKKKGKEVYHINIGQPDISSPSSFFEALKNFNKEVITYAPSQGAEKIRKAFANYFNQFHYGIEPDDVIITLGGSEALIFAFYAVADANEEVIVFEPFYTNYNLFARLAGCKLVPVPTKIEEKFAIPPYEEIKKYITSRTKAILYASPNNPTGKVYTEEELEAFVKLVKEYNLFLIADEVYREFVYGDVKHKGVMELEEIKDRCILIDSVSKRYSLCGARVGCIVSKNRELMANVLKLAQGRLSCPEVEQYACAEVIEKESEFIQMCKVKFKKRIDISMEILENNSEDVVYFRPEGAFYTMLKLPVENAEDFAIFLLKEFSKNGRTSMVAPGDGFYSTKGKGKNEIRISFVYEEEKMKEAVEIVIEGLKEYRRTK
jgi:aspartate aminotransferase